MCIGPYARVYLWSASAASAQTEPVSSAEELKFAANMASLREQFHAVEAKRRALEADDDDEVYSLANRLQYVGDSNQKFCRIEFVNEMYHRNT